MNCKESILFAVESICRKKWKNIRDTYRKCNKRRDLATRSGAGYKRLPECAYFNQLSFLRDTVTSKQSESNFTLTPNNATQSPSVDADVVDDEPSRSSRHSPVSSTSEQLGKEVPALIPTKRKFRAREREDISTVLDLQLINHLKKQGQDESTGRSENESFCKSLIPILDRLDNRKNQLVRIQIQQVLFNIEFEQDIED